MIVIVTMAGRGQRFRDSGYAVAKYRVRVAGRSLFSWSMTTLRNLVGPHDRFVFVALADDAVADFVAAEWAALGIPAGYDIHEIDTVTDGQASTAMLAVEAVDDPAEPICIFNIDTYVEPAHLVAPPACDGWVPCFPGRGDGWSFVRADADGRALEVREKRRISAHASIGLYGFSSARLFRQAYRSHFLESGPAEAGERYVAPLYNRLIGDGRRVVITALPAAAVHPLGTPADVQRFAAAAGATLVG